MAPIMDRRSVHKWKKSRWIPISVEISMTRFALPVRAESRSAPRSASPPYAESRKRAPQRITPSVGPRARLSQSQRAWIRLCSRCRVFHPALCRFERGSIRVETAAENHMGENRFYTEPARRCGNRQSCRPETILPTSAHRPARRHARPAIVQISDFPRHAYRNR